METTSVNQEYDEDENIKLKGYFTSKRKEQDEDRGGDEDIDVKKMKVDFMETKQIMEIVKEFVKDYTSS